jgi:hypothetical protein
MSMLLARETHKPYAPPMEDRVGSRTARHVLATHSTLPHPSHAASVSVHVEGPNSTWWNQLVVDCTSVTPYSVELRASPDRSLAAIIADRSSIEPA